MIRSVKDSQIEAFLRDASSLAHGSFQDNSSRKKDILRRYFGRFGSGSSQDLDRYDRVQVGAIFSRLYQSYKKR